MTGRFTHDQSRLLVLVDMDMVLCDFELRLLQNYQQTHPSEPFIPLDDRQGFYARDQYVKKFKRQDLAEKVREVYSSQGFLKDLPEIPGACSAVQEMSQMENVDVFICTSPLTSYEFCLNEKYAWVEEHLGVEWLERLIITKDKTVVNGHILIDDRVNVKGALYKPSWEHVVFTACHNTKNDLRGKRRLSNWTDGSWRDLILDWLKRV